MNIFIDEAGIFVIPKKKKWSISCVGALVIPEEITDSVLSGFEKLKEDWRVEGKEIKGSKLNESEVNSLILFLSQFDVIFQVTAIDMVTQSNSGITKHRMIQADKMTENLTAEHYQSLIDGLENVKERIQELTNQLYVQAVCTCDLMYTALQNATLYYAQRKPEELAQFNWSIDAKHQKITPYEKLWLDIVLPFLQSRSIRDPFIQLKEANYSYFEKYTEVMTQPPEYLKKAFGEETPFPCVHINDIYRKNLIFDQSHENLGLQIVDILTTSIRRAMNGHLKIHGWGKIGQLMVQSSVDSQEIKLLSLSKEKEQNYKGKKPPYWMVVPMMKKTSKSMLTKN